MSNMDNGVPANDHPTFGQVVKGTPQQHHNNNNNMWGLVDPPIHVNSSTQLLHSNNFASNNNMLTAATQQENSLSIISSPNSASAANNSVSIMRFVKDNMWQFFSVIQHRYVVKGKKIYILFTLLHIYYSYVVMILPTLSSQITSPLYSSSPSSTSSSSSTIDTSLHNYPYGLYGTWLFRAMNYPITLSLDWIPYEAAIAITVFGLVLALIHISFLFLTFKTNFGRLQEKLKNISFMLAVFILFIGPPTAFVMTSFIDCNYQHLIYSDVDKMYSASLWRYPNVMCSSSMNVSMIVVSLISIVLFSFGWLFSLFILPMANPKSEIPFLISYKLPMCAIYTSTGMRILVHFAIPSEYAYARAIFHIVVALGFILFFTNTVPLYRRVENSVFFSVLCAYCAFGVGLLTSSLVNLSSSSEYDTLGIGLGAGLTIGLAIITWILSFISFETYTRVVFRNIQKIVKSKMDHENHDNFENAQSSIYIMCSEYSMRNLKFYLQFTSHMPQSQDMAQALNFVKSESPQKFFTSPSLLMMASDLVARCWGDENRLNFALFLLKKALKHNEGPWLAMQIKFKLRDVESELFENANYGKFGYQVKNVLMEIEKKQDQIKSIHKLFWKELLSDIPSNEKLERINATATHLTHYCEDQFEHLLANFAHDKTVLRYYANFLETIKQDKESASTYYEEASTLEEEDYKNNKYAMKRFRNKVIPELAESNSWRLTRSSSKKELNNEDVEKDSFGGIEKQMEKKQNIYRTSLNAPFKSRSRLVTYFFLILTGLSLLVIAFILSLVYGDFLSKTDLVKVSSLPILAPGALLRDIRMKQIIFELFNNENKTFPSNGTRESNSLNYFLSNYKERIRNQRNILLDLSSKSRSGEFTTKMYSDFIREDSPIFIPVASESGKVEYKTYFSKNTSISDVVHELIQHSTFYNLAPDLEFNKTTTSYPFMYIYHNRRTAADVTFLFFKNFQESQRFLFDNINDLLWNYILISALVYIGVFLGFIIISRVEMQRISFILALYRKLPKDMIGVIYHEIDKKGEDVKYDKSNILLKPKQFSVVVAFFVVFIVAAYSGIIYFEISENVNTSTNNLTTVNQLSYLIRTAHRLTIRLGELFAYFGVPYGIPINVVISPSYISQYRQDVRGFVSSISSSYNEVVYGTNTSQPLIGRFPKIDNIINGPSNCTADSPVEECSSLQTFISAFTISSSQMVEEFFNPSFQKMDSLFYQVLALYNMNDVLYDKLIDLMNLLFISTSESYKILTITFFIVGVILYALFSVLLLYSFLIYDRQITNLRSFLNYLPVDYIDSSEAMRNFIYFNSLTIFKNKKNTENQDDSLRNVLSSMVDGALLVNEKSEIMLFNLTAQKMFGKAPEEVIGLRFYSLFDPSQSEKLTAIIKQVKSSLTDPNGKHGETLELDCIRKNQSKFPAIVNIFATREHGAIIYAFFIKDITSEKKQNALLNEEKKNSENLLRNILPDSVAFKLKAGETLIADKFSDITCFFSDMVGFTKFSSAMNPNELVIMLNTVVNGFDDLTDKYHLEKIKTIGDAYFCVGGLHGLNEQSDHPERCVKFSIDTLQVIKDYNIQNPHAQINIRVGLNTGSVVAGVIGRKKFAYDLWGDTINIASRMESTGAPGRIQLSRSTYERTYDIFEFEERKIEVKGKGLCLAYLLKEKHHCNPHVTIESKDEDEMDTNDEIEVEKKDHKVHNLNTSHPHNNSTPNVMSDTILF